MYVEIDVTQELEPYLDRFDRLNYNGDKLQCCSPFRDDMKPSFAVNLVDGTWVDSGATDDGMLRGNFVKLLALLQDITYEESLKDIMERYTLTYADVDQLELNMKLDNPFEERAVPLDIERPVHEFSAYLEGRGITTETQSLFGITVVKGAVGFPVQDRHGKVVNVKYRKLGSKQFWYQVDQPIKQYLYGMYQALQVGTDTIYVTEGEVDALYLWSHYVCAVATFGASVTDKQVAQLKQFKKVVLAVDNDEVGKKFQQTLIDRLGLDVEVWILDIPSEYKDVNDIPSYKLGRAIASIRKVEPEIKFNLF